MIRTRAAALIFSLILPASCGESPNAPAAGARVVIGVIETGGTLDKVLSGPRTGSVGEQLLFTVTTFGSGRAGDAFLRVQGRSYLGPGLTTVTQQMPISPTQ